MSSSRVVMNLVAVLMLAVAVGVVVLGLGPGLCSVQAHNLPYFRLGGYLFASLVAISLATGVAFFRFRLIRRAEDPFSYWFCVLGYAFVAAFGLYPVYSC